MPDITVTQMRQVVVHAQQKAISMINGKDVKPSYVSGVSDMIDVLYGMLEQLEELEGDKQ